MKIIIPMSGFGERFRRAGYLVPKPLVEVEGKPIIAHVIDMFPGESDFLFICNQDHLNDPAYRMAEILQHYCPTGTIVGIPPHKFGPIHAVRQIEHLLDKDQPVIVNYCDFTCYWDWRHFKNFVRDTRCAGAIPAYKGFHPHSLGNTNYAYMLETGGWLQDIQEKQPFTENRMEEYASSGTYYFASAEIMHDAFHEVLGRELKVGGEYYVSLAYLPMLEAKKAVAVYPLQHFMQWGTPADVAEYNTWSRAFRGLVKPASIPSIASGRVVMPMAGLGQRFAKEGYTLTKPLIPVSGSTMVTQAVHDLPPAQQYVFVLRSDMPGHAQVSAELLTHYPGAVIESIPHVTEGQACTALIGLDALERANRLTSGPVTIGACDNGAIYQNDVLQALLDKPEVDVVVWGVRGHAQAVRHPNMFGWIDASTAGEIHRISVKRPLSVPETDAIVLGTFTFRKADDFRRSVARMVLHQDKVNQEFYIDSAINHAIALGLRCHLFEVDSFLCWGTPDDLRTFEYWQSCFHKWDAHPYRMENDVRVAPTALIELNSRYARTLPQVIQQAV